MKILWKGANMKTSFAGKALSWMLAAMLCFSLTPAWAKEAKEAVDTNPKQQTSSSQAESTEGLPSDSQETPTGLSEATQEEGERASASIDSEESDALDPAGDGAFADGTGDVGDDEAVSEEKPDAAEDPDAPEGDTSVEAPIEEGAYLIRSLTANTMVLDVAGGSIENSANVQLYGSNMTAAQRFRAVVDENGWYTFVNENSGKVLDVADGKAEPGANVQQYAENGTDGQKWRLVECADGSFKIESKLAEGLMLDVADGRGVNGANVQVYAENEALAQRFVFVDVSPEVPASDSVPAGTYYLQSALDTSLSLSIMDRSRDNGADACLAWGDAATSRQFTITIGEDGYATLRNVNSGRMLDAADGNLVPGTRVQQYGTQAVANAQKWAFRANDDGTYTVVSKASGLALDVCDAVANGGVRVQLYTPNGTAGQKWVLTSVERALEDGLYTFSTLLDGGKSVTVQDNATADGTRVQLWSRSGVPAQKFLLSWHAYSVPSDPANEDEGVQQEGGSSTEAALDAPEEEIPEQSPVEAWAVTLRPMTGTGQYLTAWDNRAVTLEQPSESEWLRQLWIPTYASAGGVQFQNVATKEMLDVSDAGTYDGCPIGTYPSNNTLGQAYYADIVDPIDQGTYIVQSVSDGRALDVVDGSRSNGANVQLWTPNDSGAQAWVIEGVGGGFYNVINARSKKALDVADGVWAAQTNVQQYTRNWSNAQKWYAVANEDGSYSFVSPDGLCALDAADGGGWDGANVQIYDANGSAAQKWRLIPTTYVPQDFEDLLGSFTTYSTNTWNGTYNMQRALNSFNGVVLQPGESVSFFGVAGPCGAAEGYLPAGVVGGVGYGGGICQASTTIYGAAIRAGFGIVDRQNHSVPSTYVPIGLDAMVNWGTSDLVVRNDTDYPAKFVIHTYDNVLTCEIWGIQPDWYDYIEPISWYTSSSSANAQRIYYKDGVAVYTEWLPSSYYW